MVAKREQPLRGVLSFNEPMSKHTSWRVGGEADQYFQPADIDDLALFLSQLGPDESLTWVGLGSNLLVRDGGIRGAVIATSGVLNGLQRLEGLRVRAEAGVSCAKVARFCARQGLTGAEFLAGIPGTMGGALAMNAGAFGGETWEVVSAVETLHRGGQRFVRLPDEYVVGYRTLKGPDNEWFVAAELELKPGNVEAGQARIKELLARRSESQPTQMPNAGSVFKNPVGDHAARLIEASGLKGARIGDACVSEKHSNFIVNLGNATAADIEALINKVRQTVESKQGVSLEREVRIIGEELK
ncbi:MAG: UDP-N-acetylmuramate dehydrogenase [Gammaproteobacteria bacterium]|nr:UDP-N-acetylmuramate dehydrogenase [Gammaproteobacteria bacterium]MDH5800073.1 UDP-N-acetylmuramate dehydrogenase [Gammaproteobacteria bacterium]